MGLLLSSLVRQVLAGTGHIPNSVQTLYDDHSRKGTRPSRGEYIQAQISYLKLADRAFIVIDALDELETDRILPQFLDAVLELHPAPSLLVTSRHVEKIHKKLSGISTVEIEARNADVRKHCEKSITTIIDSHLFNGDSDPLRQELVELLVCKAKEMYVMPTIV